MRPWMAAMSLEALALSNLGYVERYGLETYFLQRAKEKAKPVSELETAQEQLKLFTDLTPSEADLYLRATLLELGEPVHPIEKYATFWKEGDAEGFYSALNGSRQKRPELNNVMDRLINQRNRTLTQRLIPFFRRGGRTFFGLVGAAHLVGSDGIPSLMAQAGYKVTQL
jgi:uncharacterized protein YbaP (TraB family)